MSTSEQFMKHEAKLQMDKNNFNQTDRCVISMCPIILSVTRRINKNTLLWKDLKQHQQHST